MVETTETSTSRAHPPEEFHWGIAYLREDIQDLRTEIRGVHSRIEETNRRIDERFDVTNQRIDEKHESLAKRLDSRFALTVTLMMALAGVLVAVFKI